MFPHQSTGFTDIYNAELSPLDFIFLADLKADKTIGAQVLCKTSLPTGVCLKAVGGVVYFGKLPFLSCVERQTSLFSLWVAHMP